MPFQEGVNEINLPSGRLKYKYKPSTTNRRKVLVIFSGFRPNGTLDFSGAAIDPIRQDVFWIFDEFGPQSDKTYYLRHNGTDLPEKLVVEFFEEICSHFNVNRESIVTAGFSKGGSAALYFSSKLGLGGCISAVPQFKMGSYLKTNWPKYAKSVAADGADPAKILQEMDHLLEEQLAVTREDRYPVYLITSRADKQYDTEIIPNLELIRRNQGFNLIEVNSAFVDEHKEVTPYSVPIIQGLMLLLLEGLAPGIGEQKIEDFEFSTSPRATSLAGTAEANLRKLDVNAGRLIVELDTIIRGYNVDGHGVMSRKLKLEDTKLPLGSVIDPQTTLRNVRWEQANYDAGLSATMGRKGLEISNLPFGKFLAEVELNLRKEQLSKTCQVNSSFEKFVSEISEEYCFRAVSDKNGLVVEKLALSEVPIASNSELDRLEQFKLDDARKLHVRGRFCPPGAIVEEWGQAKVALLVENDREVVRTWDLGILHRPTGVPKTLAKSTFANVGGIGIPLSDLHAGLYRARVLLVTRAVAARTVRLGIISVSESGQVELLKSDI